MSISISLPAHIAPSNTSLLAAHLSALVSITSPPPHTRQTYSSSATAMAASSHSCWLQTRTFALQPSTPARPCSVFCVNAARQVFPTLTSDCASSNQTPSPSLLQSPTTSSSPTSFSTASRNSISTLSFPALLHRSHPKASGYSPTSTSPQAVLPFPRASSSAAFTSSFASSPAFASHNSLTTPVRSPAPASRESPVTAIWAVSSLRSSGRLRSESPPTRFHVPASH